VIPVPSSTLIERSRCFHQLRAVHPSTYKADLRSGFRVSIPSSLQSSQLIFSQLFFFSIVTEAPLERCMEHLESEWCQFRGTIITLIDRIRVLEDQNHTIVANLEEAEHKINQAERRIEQAESDTVTHRNATSRLRTSVARLRETIVGMNLFPVRQGRVIRAHRSSDVLPLRLVPLLSSYLKGSFIVPFSLMSLMGKDTSSVVIHFYFLLRTWRCARRNGGIMRALTVGQTSRLSWCPVYLRASLGGGVPRARLHRCVI